MKKTIKYDLCQYEVFKAIAEYVSKKENVVVKPTQVMYYLNRDLETSEFSLSGASVKLSEGGE